MLVEERKAYKRWWALHQRKKKLGVTTRKKKRVIKKDANIKYGKDYLFYYENFRKENARLDRLFRNRRKRALYYARVFTTYYNHLLQVVEKYGTDEDKKKLEVLSNEEFK